MAVEPEEVTPAACSILNTDVVVDLQPPLGPDGQPLVIPPSSAAAAHLDRQLSGSQLDVAPLVLGGETLVFSLASADPRYRYLPPFRVPLGTAATLVVNCVGSDSPAADFEIYLSDGLDKPTLEQHRLTCNVGEYVRAAEVAIPPLAAAVSYTVGVRPYGDAPGGMTLAAQLVPTDSREGFGHTSENAAMPMIEDGKVECSTCGSMVPAARAALHEAYCARNNTKCLICDRTLRKADRDTHWHCGECADPSFLATTVAGRDKHLKLFHVDIACPCGQFAAPLLALQRHFRDECPARRITCRFCFNEMAAGVGAEDAADRFRGYTEHESRCGSKTTQCHKCHAHIRRRDLESHAKLHMLDDASKKTALTSGVAAGRRPTEAERAAAWARAGFGPDTAAPAATPHSMPMEEDSSGGLDPVNPIAPSSLCQNVGCARSTHTPNTLGLCPPCWAALPPPADQTPKSVVKSLVKSYFAQLTKGCGFSQCTNSHCATANPSSGMSGSPAAALAVKLAQSALAGQVNLCLSESAVSFSSSVSALEAMGFPPEWASCALERTGSEQDAAVWLLANYT